MSRVFVSFCAAVALAGSIPAQDSRPESRRSLAAVVADLDAEDFDVREKAMRDILLAGAEARDFLEAAREEGSLERRLRIDDLLSRLAVRRAESRGTESRSVALKDVPLDEACRLLSATYGIVVRPATDADGGLRVDADIVDATPLQAIDRTCASARATFYRDVRDGAYLIRSSPDVLGPVAYVDGLRVALTQATVSRSLRFGGISASNAYLQIQIDVEPNRSIVGVLAPVALGEALDESGRTLVQAEANRPSYVQRLDASGRIGVMATLAPPEPDAKLIKRARFDLKVVVPETVGEVEIMNPVADPDRMYGDGPVKAIVEEWSERADTTSVRIALDRPQPTGEGAPQSNVFDDRVVFLMQDGRVVEPRTSGIRGGVGRSQFVAEIPTGVCVSVKITSLLRYAVRDVPVAFEDVPLP